MPQANVARGVYGADTKVLNISTKDMTGQRVIYTVVVYKSLGVVRFKRGSRSDITLTAPPSERTQTVKARMNQAAVEYNLPYRVRENSGKWFVDDGSWSTEGENATFHKTHSVVWPENRPQFLV